MSVNLEKIMVEQNQPTSNLAETVDAITRARCGSLSARGLSDLQIADVLLLTYDQVLAIRETAEFKGKYAEEANRIIQEQIDRDEGWDAVETQALTQLMSTLQFTRDPKFALQAAMVANRAERRTKNKDTAPKVIGDGEAKTNNIIFLQINKNYAQRENSMIDVSPRPKEIPLKQSDAPAPKLVDQILAAGDNTQKVKAKTDTEKELTEMFKQAGVVFDSED